MMHIMTWCSFDGGLQHAGRFPQTPPLWRSRMSCVTHYCPATSMPHWFSEQEKRGIEPYFDYAGLASSFYQLPNLSQSIRPMPMWEFYE